MHDIHLRHNARPYAEFRQNEQSLSYTGAPKSKFLFRGASRSRNSASDREQRSLRQTFPNAATDESECKRNKWDVDVGEPSLTRSLKREKFSMLCIWPFVLHIDLKALDSVTPSSLYAALNWNSASVYSVELAPLGKPKYHDEWLFYWRGPLD